MRRADQELSILQLIFYSDIDAIPFLVPVLCRADDLGKNNPTTHLE